MGVLDTTSTLRLSRNQYYSSWKMFQPSYLPEIQIWLVSGYSRLIESRKKNGSLQHKSTRWRCGILGRWTTIASSKTWAGSATNMWTRCPRQAWPHSSLIIKHYWVQEGEPSTRVSKFFHKSGLALMKELLLLEQINQWLGVLGIHIDWRLQVFKPQHSSHVCMTDLGWFQGNKTSFLEFMMATCIRCTWIKGSHYLHPNICFMS